MVVGPVNQDQAVLDRPDVADLTLGSAERRAEVTHPPVSQLDLALARVRGEDGADRDVTAPVARFGSAF